MVTLYGDSFWRDLSLFHQQVQTIAATQGFVTARKFIYEGTGRVQDEWALYNLLKEQGLPLADDSEPRWTDHIQEARLEVMSTVGWQKQKEHGQEGDRITESELGTSTHEREGGDKMKICHQWRATKKCRFETDCKFKHVG